MRYPTLLVVVATVFLLVTSAFAQPPQSSEDKPQVPPSPTKPEVPGPPTTNPEGTEETPDNKTPTPSATVQDGDDGEGKGDQASPKPEGVEDEPPTGESDGTTTETTDSGNPDRELPRAIANRVKKLEERLSQVEEANKPQQPNRLPAQIVSGALLIAVAIGLILFLWRRPDRSLLNGMREVGDYIRAEDDEEQAPTETADGEPPATRDGQDEGADELFSIIGRVGRSLLFLITFTWLLLGAIPIVLSLSDTTISGTFGDTFGFVNAWFSGLALAGVILAIVMQTIELRYQRKELKQTRKELARSANAASQSQEQLAKQTFLSFLATYLGALEAVAKLSPDPEGTPGRQKQTASVAMKLKTLLFRLERDSLEMGLVAEAEHDEATALRLNWNGRFREVQEYLSDHWATRRRNNGGAVGQAQELLKLAGDQLAALRQEAEGVRNEKLLTSIDDLRRQLHELVGFRFREDDVRISTGGRSVSRRDGEYTKFWEQGAKVIRRFGAIVKAVRAGTYDNPQAE